MKRAAVSVLVMVTLAACAPGPTPTASPQASPTATVSASPSTAAFDIECGSVDATRCHQVVEALDPWLAGARSVSLGAPVCAPATCPPLFGPDFVVGALVHYADERAPMTVMCMSMAGSAKVTCEWQQVDLG